MCVPVGADAGIVCDLVIVHLLLALRHKPLLLPVRPDTCCSHDGLLEVGVYWGACGRLQTLQLTRGCHIETLDGIGWEECGMGVEWNLAEHTSAINMAHTGIFSLGLTNHRRAFSTQKGSVSP